MSARYTTRLIDNFLYSAIQTLHALIANQPGLNTEDSNVKTERWYRDVSS